MAFNAHDKRNLSMLIDFYELTMANGYLQEGLGERTAVFDLFFRKIPDDGGFAIFAGLQQVISYLENLSFSQHDIEYLRKKEIFSQAFLDYLLNFKFSCDVYSVPEGTVIFPNEPLLTVCGPVIEAQLLETMLLITVNHQSLIATKASRISRASQGRVVSEFGSRRAQSYDAAVLGARAAYIGGCASTSCTMADRDYGVPASGTMAHSYVQLFDTEYEAFCSYAKLYPGDCTLLVDTYSTLRSGVPNAIKVFDEVLKPQGYRPKAIRIDSGDIAYLSKKARQMLDGAGYEDVKIVASNSLDEYIIRDLLFQNAKVDIFGVGENLITSRSNPVFGGVYKLVAVKADSGWLPKIKISETPEKITVPHFKNLYRLYNSEGKAMADYITLRDESLPNHLDEIEIFDPNAVWKRKTLTDVSVRQLQVQIFKEGKCVYTQPTLEQAKAYCLKEVNSLWDEVLRFEYPHTYYVDHSQKLYDEKQALLASVVGRK